MLLELTTPPVWSMNPRARFPIAWSADADCLASEADRSIIGVEEPGRGRPLFFRPVGGAARHDANPPDYTLQDVDLLFLAECAKKPSDEPGRPTGFPSSRVMSWNVA
jgi:hypothetical protein